MPIAKKATAAKTEDTPVVEPTVEPTPEKKTVKAGSLVKCQLIKGNRLYQPSTKKHIIHGDIEELKADGWLKLQVEAGLIELVG